MAQWYYTVNGQQAGPVDDGQMRAMIQNGQVQQTDLIWREGMASWSEARTVPEFSGGAAAAPAYQQPQGYQQPGYAQPVGYRTNAPQGTPPKNWLVESIILVFCCWPLAIPAIIFAAQVNSKWAVGDIAGAQSSAKTAKTCVMIGFIGFGAVMLFYVAMIFLGAMTSGR